jgi:hypothetical protein
VKTLARSDIIVVDDRPDTLVDLLAVLRTQGLRPRVIEDYDAAWDEICECESWHGFGLFDLHLPAMSDDEPKWLGLELGRQVLERFGVTAKFAYISVLARAVPLAQYEFSTPTSALAVLDKYDLDSQHVARVIAAELDLANI